MTTQRIPTSKKEEGHLYLRLHKRLGHSLKPLEITFIAHFTTTLPVRCSCMSELVLRQRSTWWLRHPNEVHIRLSDSGLNSRRTGIFGQ